MRRQYVETTTVQQQMLVGSVFDRRFKVLELVATGGFGAIYRVQHLESGHDLALKVLLPELARKPSVVARFRREGKALTALRNPHTIAAYELGQTDDHSLFIVMELLRGKSLYEHLNTHGSFEWRRMVKIAREVCESLAEAHELGIVHRDLKPTNIHLETQGDDKDYVKVLDFGIAKILRGSELDTHEITNVGQTLGTLDYMSPEQLVGTTVTGVTDIFALGVLIYEMIADRPPFPESETPSAALSAIVKTKPQPLSKVARVPAALDKLVMRCLERDPKLRYQSAREMREALGKLVDAQGADTTIRVERPQLTESMVAAVSPAFPVERPALDDQTTIAPPPDAVLAVLRGSTAPPSYTAKPISDELTQATTFGEELDLTVRAPGLTPPSPHEQATVPTPKAVLEQVRAAAAKEQSRPPPNVEVRPEIGKPLPHRLPSHAGSHTSKPGQLLAELVAQREKSIRRAIWGAVIAVVVLVAIALLTLR